MSDSSSSDSSSNAVSPKPLPKSEPNSIPKVVYRQTARMRTMCSSLATKGKQLAVPSIPKLAPAPMKRTRRRRQPAPKWTYSMEPSEDDSEEDPEDNPDNEFGVRYLGTKRHSSNDIVDESDEEERGDQDRRSRDDTYDDYRSDSGSDANNDRGDSGSDNNDYFANDDGYDSSF